ncbi:MAG: hypothetical protein ACHP9Z_01370, partial [Streptosporangiales bacterium]
MFLLTLVAAGAAWQKISGPYQAESMVALIPSKQAAKPDGNNPLMAFGGSESVAGDIVQRQVMAPPYAAKLASEGYTASFAIVDDPTSTGPIVDITVTGSNQAEVANTLRGVTAAFTSQLATLQQAYVPANRITSQVISYQPTPKLLVSKKARDIVIVIGLGLVLTYAIPQIVDGEIRRRRAAMARASGPTTRAAAGRTITATRPPPTAGTAASRSTPSLSREVTPAPGRVTPARSTASQKAPASSTPPPGRPGGRRQGLPADPAGSSCHIGAAPPPPRA